jgi:hypothetical protein
VVGNLSLDTARERVLVGVRVWRLRQRRRQPPAEAVTDARTKVAAYELSAYMDS